MKLAYIVFLTAPVVGVQKSIQEKARAFHDCGIDIDVFVLNPAIEKEEGHVKYVRLKSHLPGALKYSDYLFRRFLLIEKSVCLLKYDCIILRYPCSDASGVSFTKKYKIVTEHHTDVRNEFLATLSAPGSFPVKLVKRLRAYLENRYGRSVLENCEGLIAVTDEIRRIESSRSTLDVKAITVSNGIDVRSVTHTRFRRFNGDELAVAFVASSMNPWHGMERLQQALNLYRGPPRISLHIIGNITEGEVSINNTRYSQVIFHGEKTGRNLDAVLSKATLAISTLGLYKKQMEEACTLKTREYTARGLPFIIGYTDPDLTQVDLAQKFFLQIPNDDSLVDLRLVIAFATKMSECDNPERISAYMRDYAITHLDWKPKMKAYERFCNEL